MNGKYGQLSSNIYEYIQKREEINQTQNSIISHNKKRRENSKQKHQTNRHTKTISHLLNTPETKRKKSLFQRIVFSV